MAGENSIFDGTVEAASSRQNSIGGLTIRTTAPSTNAGSEENRQIYANAIVAGNSYTNIETPPTGFDSGVTVTYNSTMYHYLYTATTGTLVTDLNDVANTTIYTQTF